MPGPSDRPENSIKGGFIVNREDSKDELRVEVPRADRLQPATIKEPELKSTVWPRGRKRRTKLAVLGIPSGILDKGDPAYARCVRLASAYRKSRVRELSTSHGFVSSGASALLASASMALAASRYLYEQAAEKGPEQIEYLKTASRLADSARQNELAAWELCAREAVATKKSKMANAGVPWVVEVDDDSGYQKRKPGPKRRDDTLLLPPIGQPLDGFIRSANLNEGQYG